MAQRPPEIPQEMPAARRRRSPAFAIWTVAATLSALYLCAVSIRPAFLDGILPPSSTATADKTAADIVNVRDNIGQLQTDMAKVQSDIATHTDVARGIESRVAALEQKIAPPDASASALPSATPAAPAPAAEPSAAERKQTKGPRVINSDLETGSVHGPNEAAQAPPKPAPEKAAAAVPAKPKKPVGIKLATGGSVDNLRSSWNDLSARHSQELSALQPRYYNNVTGDGINYELVAGPFKSTADAKKVCQTLKAQAIDCQVSNFSGNPL